MTENQQHQNSPGYTLTIRGFNTKEEVLAFASWYEAQGEQDSVIWFECRKEEGEINTDIMSVDIHKYNKELKAGFKNNNFDLWLKMNYR